MSRAQHPCPLLPKPSLAELTQIAHGIPGDHKSHPNASKTQVGGALACGRRKDEQRAGVAAARRGAHLRARERQNRVRRVPGQALDAGLPDRQLQQVRLGACACSSPRGKLRVVERLKSRFVGGAGASTQMLHTYKRGSH